MGWTVCPQCHGVGQYKETGSWLHCRRCGGTDAEIGIGAIDDGIAPPTATPPRPRWRFVAVVGASVTTLIIFSLLALVSTHLFNITLGSTPAVMAASTATPFIITATPFCPPLPPPGAPPPPMPFPPGCPQPPTPTLPPTPNGTVTTGPFLEVNPANFIHRFCYNVHDVLFLRNGGTGTVYWAANTNGTTYNLLPSSSQTDAQKSQQVVISNVLQTGSVTFTSNGGNVVVTETCTG